MKKIVVTGPTGAIGTALIRYCLEQGTQVTAVCRRNSERISAIPDSPLVKILPCNLDELERLPGLAEGGYDVFYHLAWDGTFGNSRNHMSGQVKNIQYTLDAVQAAHAMGCRRFVGAGSQAEYGRTKELLRPDTPAFPENGYGMAKLCAGQMSRVRCEQLGLEHVWLRVLSVYGPWDGRNTMVMSVIRKLLDGEEPSLSPGEQIWDYLYCADAGRGFYLAGERGRSGKVYPLGSGEPRPLSEYVQTIRDSIDPRLGLGFGKLPYSPAQVMYLGADISEFTRDTGFQPQYSFKEGIEETIRWCRRKNK